MQLRKTLLLGLLACASLTPVAAVAQATKTFATSEPYGLLSGSQLPDRGLATLVFDHLFKAAGIPADVIFTAQWSDAEGGARSNEFTGAFPYYYTIERTLDFQYSDAVLAVGERVYTNGEQLTSLDGLKGETLCYPAGYDFATSLRLREEQGEFTRISAPDMNTCFQSLVDGEVFAVLSDQSEAAFVMNFADFDISSVRESAFDIAQRTLHLIVSHKEPGGAEMLEAFNTALEAARADGSLDRLVRERIDISIIPDRSDDFRTRAAVEARLRLNDGTYQTGRIVEIDTGKYEVATKYGPVIYPLTFIAELCPVEGCAGEVAATAPAEVAEAPVEAPAEEQTDVVAALVEPEPAPTALRLAGSNTIGAGLAPAMLQGWLGAKGMGAPAWQLGEPNERAAALDAALPGGRSEITLAAHGSSTGFKALLAGDSDIAMASRPIKPSEQVAMADKGLGDPLAEGANGEHIVALDGIAIIVHPDNPLRELTMVQVQQIFSGQITNWAQIGGPNAPITLYARDDASGTFDTFQSLALGDTQLASAAQRFESNANLSDAVRGDVNAIGFTGLGYVRNSKPLALRVCDAVHQPTPFAVKTEEYPLARRLFMYTAPNKTDADTEDFLQYASTDGQAIVASEGFVDLNLDVRAGWDAVDALANIQFMPFQDAATLRDYMLNIRDKQRLSATFHFVTGKSNLDARSEDDLKRLVAWMKQPENANRKVLLVGFADNTGGYEANRNIAQARAQQVADQLNLLVPGNAGIQVTSGSEEAPVACNDPSGYEKNRRVEVWVTQ